MFLNSTLLYAILALFASYGAGKISLAIYFLAKNNNKD